MFVLAVKWPDGDQARGIGIFIQLTELLGHPVNTSPREGFVDLLCTFTDFSADGRCKALKSLLITILLAHFPGSALVENGLGFLGLGNLSSIYIGSWVFIHAPHLTISDNYV